MYRFLGIYCKYRDDGVCVTAVYGQLIRIRVWSVPGIYMNFTEFYVNPAANDTCFP